MDCYSLSNFNKEPNRTRFNEEIQITRGFFETLRKNFKDAKIIYKIGNHEERLWSYLVQKAPEIFDLDELKIENLLKLDELKIDLVDKKRVTKYNKLHIIHGHEYRFAISNPVNPARGLFLRTKQSAVCFHFHQTSEHTEPTIDGSLIGTYSVGCLCGLTPEYMPLNRWNHGFAIVGSDEEFFTVDNKRIINGKIL